MKKKETVLNIEGFEIPIKQVFCKQPALFLNVETMDKPSRLKCRCYVDCRTGQLQNLQIVSLKKHKKLTYIYNIHIITL